MKHQSEALEQASVRQYCKEGVHTNVIAASFVALTEQALKAQQQLCSS